MARPDSAIMQTAATAPADVKPKRRRPMAPPPEVQATLPGGTAEQLAAAKLEAQEAKIKTPVGTARSLFKHNGAGTPMSKADIKAKTIEIKKVLAVSREPLTALEDDIAKLQAERAQANKVHDKAVKTHEKNLNDIDKKLEKLQAKATKFSAAFAKTQAKADQQIASMH